MRPARIGLLNLMPAAVMGRTEEQWLSYMSHTVLQIEPVLLKFDSDVRDHEASSRRRNLARYTNYSEALAEGLDGMIVTGDNLEVTDKSQPSQLLEFGDISYSQQLAGVIRSAQSNVFSTIYSCLASHFALNQIYGLERSISLNKVMGVYQHRVCEHTGMATNMNDYIVSPHSRWGDIPTAELQGAGLKILADSNEAGWLLAQSSNQAGGNDYFIQGHPEYDRLDLDGEYRRDKGKFGIPKGYYAEDNPFNSPILSWATDARALYANWVDEIYAHFSMSGE